MASKTRRTRSARQLGFGFRTWGGARKGAGRPPEGDRAGVSHSRRPALASRFPVHVTLRVGPEVWNLRSRRSLRVIGAALGAGAERLGLRLCEFSIQGNHIHLLVEADGQRALARGIQGLCIRMAKGLNRMMGRKGRVFSDRYHAHILRTPTEVARARAYVRDNHRKHAERRGQALGARCVDPYSSASREHGIVLPAPHTWLLRAGIARARPVRRE